MVLEVWVLVVAVAATAPEECQPKGGIHQHQPQYHVIAPMFPGENNATWPGGVNDANGIFRRDGVWHVFHQCDGGPAVRIGARWPWLSTTYSNVYACVCVSLRCGLGPSQPPPQGAPYGGRPQGGHKRVRLRPVGP